MIHGVVKHFPADLEGGLFEAGGACEGEAHAQIAGDVDDHTQRFELVDVILADIPITSEMAQFIDFSVAFLETGFSLG